MNIYQVSLIVSVILGGVGLCLQTLLIHVTRRDLDYAWHEETGHRWRWSRAATELVGAVLKPAKKPPSPVTDQLLWRLRSNITLEVVHVLVIARSVLYLIFIPLPAALIGVAYFGAWVPAAISVVVIFHTYLRLKARESAGTW